MEAMETIHGGGQSFHRSFARALSPVAWSKEHGAWMGSIGSPPSLCSFGDGHGPLASRFPPAHFPPNLTCSRRLIVRASTLCVSPAQTPSIFLPVKQTDCAAGSVSCVQLCPRLLPSSHCLGAGWCKRLGWCGRLQKHLSVVLRQGALSKTLALACRSCDGPLRRRIASRRVPETFRMRNGANFMGLQVPRPCSGLPALPASVHPPHTTTDAGNGLHAPTMPRWTYAIGRSTYPQLSTHVSCPRLTNQASLAGRSRRGSHTSHPQSTVHGPTEPQHHHQRAIFRSLTPISRISPNSLQILSYPVRRTPTNKQQATPLIVLLCVLSFVHEHYQ
ncbi:hypothetical protein B0T17DRAFT_167765 [Bombardia bombarda]|uniref:Uncharacterized protein n=1 Tax=Bombardia bombarda TaxID=252184 RepID=A0AA39X7M4_9PEZI|nr:hypothetical protein B0T17DRAFT_167765 [Bombardia bombarda]